MIYESHLGLPFFYIVDKNEMKSQVEKVSVQLEILNTRNNIEELVKELKHRLESSYEKARQSKLYPQLFGIDNYNEYLKKNYHYALELIDKVEKNILDDSELFDMKFYILKKDLLFSTIEDAWFFNEVYINFNKNIFSAQSRKQIAHYVDNGSDFYFNDPIVDSLIKNNVVMETECLLQLDKSIFEFETTFPDEENHRELINWYKFIFNKENDSYIILVEDY